MPALVHAPKQSPATARASAARAEAKTKSDHEVESPVFWPLSRIGYDFSRIALHPAPQTIVDSYPGAQKEPKPAPPPQKTGAVTPQKSNSEEEKPSAPAESAPQPSPARQPLLVRTAARKAPRAAGSASRSGASSARTAPKALSWSAIQAMPLDRGVMISGPPVSTTLSSIWAGATKGAAGFTDWPAGYKAPDFDFNTTIRRNTSRPTYLNTNNTSSPTKKTAAFEGASRSLFTAPGKYATGDKENGKDVFWNFSQQISDLVKVGEQEHCDDFAEAYRISLKEADDVLNANIYGKTFGPSPTPEKAEKLVRDTIASKLTHPQLGSDKAQWATKYYDLFNKTSTRDTSAWHSISTGTRTENAAGITYEIVKGTAQIPGPAPNTIIKY
jgi:hypothetical protein